VASARLYLHLLTSSGDFIGYRKEGAEELLITTFLLTLLIATRCWHLHHIIGLKAVGCILRVKVTARSYFSGTKETAFIYSIMSSAMVSRIARACATGNLTACSCGKHHARKRRRREEAPDTEPSHADWTWGGCSDNIEYGVKFSRMFVDAPEKIVPESSRTTKMMLNLHNTKLGRKVSKWAQVEWKIVHAK